MKALTAAAVTPVSAAVARPCGSSLPSPTRNFSAAFFPSERPNEREISCSTFAGENAWTYGRLEALEEARAERAEEQFWAQWPGWKSQLKRATRG